MAWYWTGVKPTSFTWSNDEHERHHHTASSNYKELTSDIASFYPAPLDLNKLVIQFFNGWSLCICIFHSFLPADDISRHHHHRLHGQTAHASQCKIGWELLCTCIVKWGSRCQHSKHGALVVTIIATLRWASCVLAQDHRTPSAGLRLLWLGALANLSSMTCHVYWRKFDIKPQFFNLMDGLVSILHFTHFTVQSDWYL